MSISRVRVKDFGPFADLDIQFSPELNVILGDNGTGKTFLLKLLYAALAGSDVILKLKRVFTPKNRKLKRLIRRGQPFATVSFERSNGAVLQIGIPRTAKEYAAFAEEWQKHHQKCVYIPSENVLARASGREILFDDTHADILMQAFLPLLKLGDVEFVRLLNELEALLGGSVVVDGEEFFLKTKRTKLEFPLLSEGMCRLGLLSLLVRNGSIQPGSVLLWDLPETGLNDKFKHVASAVAEFISAGVQVFVATNSLFMLREFEAKASSRHYAVRYIDLAVLG